MAAWEGLLRAGPEALSDRDALAVATLEAANRFERHKHNPSDAPEFAGLTVLPPHLRGLSHGELTQLATLPSDVRQAALEEVRRLGEGLQSPEEAEREHWRNRLEKGEGLLGLFPILRAKFFLSGEATQGAVTDAALKLAGVETVDWHSRHKVNIAGMRVEAKLAEALEISRGSLQDPPLVAEAKAAEAVFAARSTPVSVAKSATLSLFDLLDHKAKTRTIKTKTISDDRSYLQKFANFIRHSDARKVTKDDVRRWRDHLIGTGLSPKTTNDKYLSALRSVLGHGVKEFDLPTNVAAGIRDKREPDAPKGSKGYSEEDALKILAATFEGTKKEGLSLPHKRALFWVPWVLAYTGLRVSEVTQFRGIHLREERGIPFLLITPADGSTKSGKAWTVGIHEHLIDLGFLHMIRRMGEGPAFYKPYPKGTDLSKLGAKHRAKEVGTRVADWITEELGIPAPNGRPNHAWRHLFTTRSRDPRWRLDKETRDYMMGSGPVDAREDYGDWTPAVVNAEINKMPRFEVNDTGWRPE
ncbi:integrase [Mesorhizobium ephedrae]|uniref:Integrase n=2 Tax=Kumtagia ephedrae TaxID=2116701 RepID=A0A2P7RNH1_9HYPH|nr:integrase [Mesorhizobium ephedrae]